MMLEAVLVVAVLLLVPIGLAMNEILTARLRKHDPVDQGGPRPAPWRPPDHKEAVARFRDK